MCHEVAVASVSEATRAAALRLNFEFGRIAGTIGDVW
jgi:hypothetical protein